MCALIKRMMKSMFLQFPLGNLWNILRLTCISLSLTVALKKALVVVVFYSLNNSLILLPTPGHIITKTYST